MTHLSRLIKKFHKYSLAFSLPDCSLHPWNVVLYSNTYSNVSKIAPLSSPLAIFYFFLLFIILIATFFIIFSLVPFYCLFNLKEYNRNFLFLWCCTNCCCPLHYNYFACYAVICWCLLGWKERKQKKEQKLCKINEGNKFLSSSIASKCEEWQ